MSDPIVSPSELGTYLNDPNIDTTRAAYMLGLAQQLCESIVTPLPAGAAAVVLDVTARAFSNPTNVQGQTAGPYNAQYGTVAGGLWLTSKNERTLRRLAGGGGAFTFDTMPTTAGQNLPWWDLNVQWPEAGDWDMIP